MDLANKTYALIFVTLTMALLVQGQALIIPFVLAFILWFLIREIRKFMEKVKFIDEKVPSWVLSIVASMMLFGSLGFVIKMLSSSIEELSRSLDVYEANVNGITASINQTFNIDVMAYLEDFSGDFDFSTLLTRLFSSLTDLFGNTFAILLYALFLLLEETVFDRKLQAIFPDPQKYQSVDKLIAKMEKSIGDYISLKTVVSIVTGICSYFALLMIGVDAPVFWAFLIFMLNYIPTVGSLIATLFPATFALLQFGEFTPGIMVLVIVGSIQFVVGNFIEPHVLGNSLNLSSLVVLLALAFWGTLWGVTGMILSVPITVIMVIVFAEFPATRPIAILLSDKGELN